MSRKFQVGDSVRLISNLGSQGKIARFGKKSSKIRVHFLDQTWTNAWVKEEDLVEYLPESDTDRVECPPLKKFKEPVLNRPYSIGSTKDNDLIPMCTHCKSPHHTIKNCDFGADPDQERYIYCDDSDCHSRSFLLLLRRAKPHFDLDNLKNGRLDVGCASVTSALGRSQGLRKNTSICLSMTGLEASEEKETDSFIPAKSLSKSVEFLGSCIRDFRPDERSVAERLHLSSTDDNNLGAAARAEARKSRIQQLGEPGVLTESFSRSPYRGVISRSESFEQSLCRLIRSKSSEKSRPIVFLLAGGSSTGGCGAVGEPIEEVLEQIKKNNCKKPGTHSDSNRLNILSIIGDDRGLTPDDEKLVEKICSESGAKLYHVCLGSEVLFACHCVLLVNHYLDKVLHTCPAPPPRRMDISSTAGRLKCVKPEVKGAIKSLEGFGKKFSKRFRRKRKKRWERQW